MSWLLRCRPSFNLSSLIKKRTYASFSDIITVRARELDNFLRTPLPGVKSINLSFDGAWPKWDDTKQDDYTQDTKQEEHCKIELSRIMQTLALAKLETILSMDDITQLPIQIQNSAHDRTPIRIFESMNIACSCPDLGLWTFQDFENFRVEDRSTRQALLSFRQFKELHAWHAFIESKKPTPLLQAFDFTADFHTHDLVKSCEGEKQKTWVNLSPHGRGYYKFEDQDIDELSLTFARDMEANIQYFQNHPEAWQPDLYEALASDGSVYSKLGESPGQENAAKILLDRPVCELSDEMRHKVVSLLSLAEDEEVYFEERVICKRKKKAKKGD